MRLLLICLVGWWAPAAVAADALSECAAIERAMERLRCYDRIARGDEVEEPASARASEPVGEPEPPPRSASTRQPMPAVEETPAPAATPGERADSSPEPEGDAADAAGWFGRERDPPPGGRLDHVTASIVSVRRDPLGRQIISLSNGQVWIENEPGRRPIAPDQSVTIRKHRWHYELELADQPNVAVRRID